MTRITLHTPSCVTVTTRPHRLARWLLGRQETVREAVLIRSIGGGRAWVYTDNREVEPEVRREIERAVGTA